MSKIKIELKCKFGNKLPGQVIELEEKQAKSMIASGSAKLKDENTLPSIAEQNALKGQLTKANNKIDELTLELEIAKEKINELEGGKDGK